VGCFDLLKAKVTTIGSRPCDFILIGAELAVNLLLICFLNNSFECNFAVLKPLLNLAVNL
jgi:hypothetical protein